MSGNKNNLWWGPPKNFNERKHERKISWLELFYDLVYVAAISQLTHHLAEHPGWNETFFSFLVFSLVFWSWVNGSQYYDLHGNDGIRTRIFTFCQMLAVAAVAITLPGTFEGHHQGFAFSFALVEAMITYLWFSVGFYDPSHRVFNKFYTINYTIAFLLLIASAFVANETAILIWVLVLLLNLTPPLTGARTIVRVLKERGQVFTASATLVERFGLFTIIVLAESILGTVTGIAAAHENNPAAWIAFILAILIAFLLWSLYFDMTSEQETKTGYGYLQWLIFLHFPLLAALGMVGACMKVMLMELETGLTSEVRWMFCISVSTILIMIVGIAAIMKEEEEDRAYIRPISRLLIFAAAGILFVPLFGNLHTLAFMLLVAVFLFVPVFVGIKSWVKYKFYERK